MKALITNQQQIADYFRALGRLAYIIQPNIGCLILAQHQFSERIQREGYRTGTLPISETGFPTSVTLNADVRALYQLAVRHQEELEQILTEIMSKGKDKLNVRVISHSDDFDKPVVSANPSYLKAFIETGEDGYRLRLREENGWLYLDKYQQDPRLQNTLRPIRSNKFEAFTLAGSLAGAYFFWPLLAAYPIMLFFKRAVPKDQRTYFFGDLVRFLKYRDSPELMEQLFPGETRPVGKFKFSYPSIDGSVKKPTLIGTVRKDKKDISAFAIDNDKDVSYILVPELMLDLATIVDLHFRRVFDHKNYSKYVQNTGFDLFGQESLYAKILELTKWKKPTSLVHLQVPKEDRQRLMGNLEEFLQFSFEGLDVPETLYIDRYGNLHPLPTLWFPKERVTDELRRLREESLKFYSGEVSPLEFLVRNGEALRKLPPLEEDAPFIIKPEHVSRSERWANDIGAFFGRMYFIFYHKDQFTLDIPFDSYPKILAPFQLSTYKLFDKLRHGVAVEGNGKSKKEDKTEIKFDKLLEGRSILTPYSLGGRIGKLMKLGAKMKELKQEIDAISSAPITERDKLVEKVRDYRSVRDFGEEEFGQQFVEMYRIVNHDWRVIEKPSEAVDELINKLGKLAEQLLEPIKTDLTTDDTIG